MRNVEDNPEENSAGENAGSAQAAGKQLFAAIAVGAVVLTIVMLLLVLAVMQAPLSVLSDSSFQRAAGPPADYAGYPVIEESASRVVMGADGRRELEITGYVRNTGTSPVKGAEIKCYFRRASGGEALFKLPLVIDTRLEEVGDGWLMPLSSREFRLRIDKFPEDVEPEALGIEVTDVSVQSL